MESLLLELQRFRKDCALAPPVLKWLYRYLTTGAAYEGMRFASFGQCLKCLIPVNTIARLCSLAAAITSSSRTDPPG
jgi:hypothetical protein